MLFLVLVPFRGCHSRVRSLQKIVSIPTSASRFVEILPILKRARQRSRCRRRGPQTSMGQTCPNSLCSHYETSIATLRFALQASSFLVVQAWSNLMTKPYCCWKWFYLESKLSRNDCFLSLWNTLNYRLEISNRFRHRTTDHSLQTRLTTSLRLYLLHKFYPIGCSLHVVPLYTNVEKGLTY